MDEEGPNYSKHVIQKHTHSLLAGWYIVCVYN